MRYRDPLEAAMARAAALERELADQRSASREEIVRLERDRERALAEVARLREQLASKQTAAADTPAEVPASTWLPGDRSDPHVDQPLRTPWILRVLYGMLVIAVTWAVALVLTPLSGWFWLLVVALPLGGWALNFRMTPPSILSLPIFALISTLSIIATKEMIPYAFFGQEVPQLALARARSREERAGMPVRLPQTRVDASRTIDGTWVTGSGDDDYQIYAELAPVVPIQGEKEGPVTAWAVCAERRPERLKDCKARWDVPHQGGLRLDVYSGLRWTIEKKGKPLPESGFPLCLSWEDPLEAARVERRNTLLFLLAVLLGWSTIYSWAASQED